MERRGSRHLLLLGDVVAEQRLEVVLRVRFGFGTIGQEVGILVAATDHEGVLAVAGATPVGVGWEYADDRTNDAQPRDRSVDRAVAALFAARARQDAVRLNRAGDFVAAVSAMRGVARRVKSYAGSDPALREVVAQLEVDEGRWAAPMPAMALKRAHARASYALRSRSPEGKASR
jgi:hypothetical protein